MKRGAKLPLRQRLIFVASIAATLLVVAIYVAPRSIWSSWVGMLVVAGIVALAVVTSYADAPAPSSQDAMKAISKRRVASWMPSVMKQLLFWIGVVLVIELVFYVSRVIERT